MNKKSERLQQGRRQQTLTTPDPHIPQAQKPVKQKSSQKPYDRTSQKKMITRNGQQPRFHTQADETPQTSKLNSNLLNVERRGNIPYNELKKYDKYDKIDKIDKNQKNQKYFRGVYQSDHQSKSYSKDKHRKIRNHQDLFRILKDQSDNYDTKQPNQPFRRPHQINQSRVRRPDAEEYVSGSLENLTRNKIETNPRSTSNQRQPPQKSAPAQTPSTPSRKLKLRNMLFLANKEQPHSPPTPSNPTHKPLLLPSSCNDAPPVVKKSGRNIQKRDLHRRIFLEKDDSLQKFQIKFQKPNSNKYDLSREEIQVFGDRFPDGFDKVKLLGRGGFSLVWLGEHKKSKKKYAVKQIITDSTHQTHVKEIWFGTFFFEFGGAPKSEFAHHPGINNLVKLYYYFINKKDTWLLYEKCGDSLGNALYDLKGQRINNQKLYKIHPKPLYTRLQSHQNQLKRILLQICFALQLLGQTNIIHSDLKTQNILIRQRTPQELTDSNQSWIGEIKLIDYGSSFVFTSLRQFSMATPEYMAPEVLNFILFQNQMEFVQKLLDYVRNYDRPWVIDMWSLGCVLLELVSGIPLWMSLKTVVLKPGDNKELIKYGLFAVKGRVFDKIIRKQIEVIQNLDYYLDNENYSGIKIEEDLRSLLKRMLALNPEKRISPIQAIQFLQKSLQK